MVSTRSPKCTGVLTRKKSAAELIKGRPKRNVSPKNLDDSVSGLSWREERELKKALYASLQEARRQSRDEKTDDIDFVFVTGEGPTPSVCDVIDKELSNGKSWKASEKKTVNPDFGKSTAEEKEKELKRTKFHAQRKFAVNSFAASHSSEMVRSGLQRPVSSVFNDQKKIHAQRKFAQGSMPCTPSETPSKPKMKVSPVKLFPVRPKTEDFLTYLCFRGTSFLPPHLDLMNITKEESDSDIVNGKNGTRESSPASSSTVSHVNEDSMEAPDVLHKTPLKKAARASASTPDTARGFSHLKQKVDGKAPSTSRLKFTSSSQSRRRFSDSYLSSRSSAKGPLKSDRLTLKRKALATLTAARRSSMSSSTKLGKPKATLLDGDLKRNKESSSRSGYGRENTRRNSTARADPLRKRKSTSDLPDRGHSPLKRSKLSMNTRSQTILQQKLKVPGHSKVMKPKPLSGLETHPKKRFAISRDKVKRTFKPHRPVTRATTHLKSALKAAKLAASKKLKLVRKSDLGPSRKEIKQEEMRKLPVRKKSTSPEKKVSNEKSGSSSSVGSVHTGDVRIKTEQFPQTGDIPTVVQCPTYYPSDEQFKDPILYIQSIQQEAEQYGMCKIVPPSSWKMESRELEDFRFPTQVQYIHKLLHKWSPITEQLQFIKALNRNNGNEIVNIPQIGGVEIDLVKLYELVQKYGGMKGTVGKEKKWMKIADSMKIPKQSDRVSKLYAAYCKYLLAYETLSDEETEKLMDSVQAERQKQEKESTGESPLCEKCVYKGKSQPLSSFHRAARNTQMLFGRENSQKHDDIELDYWETVEKADDHVSVQSAALDTSIYGSMFPVRRDNPYARHGWNLHNLVESKGSILHHLGLIAGITVPTLHVSMLFSTKCLSCNGHNLPTVQYLHQGPGLVWYAVPEQETDKLKSALRKILPHHSREKGFVTEHDSVMVPPFKLTQRGVSMSRCVQSEEEFVVVFSSVNYCNISLGYNLSESVQYGTQEWIPYGCQAAKDLSLNSDVELFSMDAMLIFLARESTTPNNTLSILLPYLEKLVDREITDRKKLFEAGLKDTERLHDKLDKPTQKTEVLEEIIICDNSKKICYLSMVLNTPENSAFSLEQGLLHIQKRKNLKNCKLMYRYSEEELKNLIKDVKQRLKMGTSSSPSTTSPKRKPVRKTESKYATPTP